VVSVVHIVILFLVRASTVDSARFKRITKFFSIIALVATQVLISKPDPINWNFVEGPNEATTHALGTEPKAVLRDGYPTSHDVKGGRRSLESRNETCPSLEVLQDFESLRQKYHRDGFAFVRGHDMLKYLQLFGGNADELQELARAGDRLPQDPTLAFRRSKSGRFELNPGQGSVSRLQYEPFILDGNQDFKRHDSGRLRHFRGLQDDVQNNSLFQALLAFKMALLSQPKTRKRPNLNYETSKWLSTVFHMRTVTSPELVGEPALEGVHSDGVDHTMSTFVSSNNLMEGSAETFLHSWDQGTGISHNHSNRDLVLGRVCHRSPLDTLIFFDNHFKHSLSPVIAGDGSELATRDMFIFSTRKPAQKGHISHRYDSFNQHLEMPMQVFVPKHLINSKPT